jgi:hypothetical protein
VVLHFLPRLFFSDADKLDRIVLGYREEANPTGQSASVKYIAVTSTYEQLINKYGKPATEAGACGSVEITDLLTTPSIRVVKRSGIIRIKPWRWAGHFLDKIQALASCFWKFLMYLCRAEAYSLDHNPPVSSMPPEKRWIGICFLCGDEIFEGELISGTNLHNCQPGRILLYEGSAAYERWLAKQPSGSHVSLDDLLAQVEKIEAECGR